MATCWKHTDTRTEGNVHSSRWNRSFSRSHSSGDTSYEYAVGWDRLHSFADLCLQRRKSGHLLSATPYAENGRWTAELKMLERRGNVSLIVSQYCPSDYIYKDTAANFSVRRYCPEQNVHLHIKADFFEDDLNGAFRTTTAHLSTQRLGPLIVGMRGIGRTELFFLTDHPGVVAEARPFMRCLYDNRLPRSGPYLRVETPLESGIYPAICEDIRKLRPGTGRITHIRASYQGAIWKPGAQNAAGLAELHSLLEQYALAGTETLVAYGELSSFTLERLRRFAQCGAAVGIPRYFPGSFAPYGLLSFVRRFPALRRFKMADHMNVTIIDGICDTPLSGPYSVIYIGTRSDGPYDSGTLELMVRCDSREFPGIEAGLADLLCSRISRHTKETFPYAA